MDRELIKIAETVYKPLIAREILRYKQAEEGPSMKDRASALMGSAMDAGKYYGPAAGYGAGAGALAGIPLGLLAQAMLGKDKSLRAYLRSALIGGIGGAGLGAAGGAGLKHYNPELAQSLMNQADSGISGLGGLLSSGYNSIASLFGDGEPEVSPNPIQKQLDDAAGVVNSPTPWGNVDLLGRPS